MSNKFIFIIMGIAVTGIVIMGILYYVLQKKMQKSDYKRLQKLQKGTRSSGFSTEVMYQKLYLFYVKTPFIKRYILKLRRRLEILNIDDEYRTRRDASKIMTKSLAILIPLVINYNINYKVKLLINVYIINI